MYVYREDDTADHAYKPTIESSLNDSLTDDHDNYHKMRYAYDDMIEGGALRKGGVTSLFTRKHIGLVAQYAAVGFIDGIMPQTIYPFLQNYLNLPGYQTTTAQTLVGLGWSFKVFYGILSDCFPICGYRRRPYMLIGWTVCIAMLFIMAFVPVGKPYFTDPRYRNVKPDDYTPAIEATLNRSASHQGGKYIVLMMSAVFGYLLADVCADGLIVEIAQREPLEVRGTTQTVIYTTRTIANVLAMVVMGVAFNGADYGGDFNFSLSFPTLMLIVGVVMTPILPVTWFFISEERAVRVSFGMYLRLFWEIIKSRAVYQVLAYKFGSGLFIKFSMVAINPIQLYWMKVSPFNEKMCGVAANFVFAGAIWLTGKHGLNWDWRVVSIVTTLVIVAMDCTATMLAIWDVNRSQWLWLGSVVVQQIPLGIQFIVATFITVELAAEGHEGAMYGLLTTVANLAEPFATAITKNVDSVFDLSTESIQNDSHQVRRDVSNSAIIMYAMNVFSLAFLLLLPRQKEQTQALKRLGGSSRFMGIFTLCYLTLSLVWSFSTNIMAIFPSTACLSIVGGKGCDQ